jgi:uncharacterized protein YndB with AHSA1/START domain
MSTVTEPVLKITRTFDAPPERVFNAWLNREEWESWIGPEGCRCEVPLLEPRVGGRYRLQMHLTDGREIPVEGVFKSIDRPRSLSFSWGWALSGKDDTLVTLTFRAVGGKTEMTLRHDGLPTGNDREGHGKGWNSALNKLTAYLTAPA